MNTTNTKAQQIAAIDHELAKGSLVIRFDSADAVVAIEKSATGRVFVKAWRGNAGKPTWFYGFTKAEMARRYIEEFIETAARRLAYRSAKKAEAAAKKATLSAAAHWAVGDVGYTSWGYDQTNVEWFQVVEVLAKSVRVRQIAANCSDNGGPSGGKTAPRRNEFIGPAILCPVDVDGGFSAGPCYNSEKPSFRHYVRKWNGGQKYTSSNH